MGTSTNTKDDIIASSRSVITEPQYQAELVECIKQLNQSEILIQTLIGRIRVLEAENDYLVRKETECEAKLSRMKATPFFKIAIRV